MNCLTEALGPSLPGNGSVLATQVARRDLFRRRRRLIVDLAKSVLQRRRRVGAAASIATREGVRECDAGRHRHGRLDQHRAASSAAAGGGPSTSTGNDIDALSRRLPCMRRSPEPGTCMEDVHRAGGIIRDPGRTRPRWLLEPERPPSIRASSAIPRRLGYPQRQPATDVRDLFLAAPGGMRHRRGRFSTKQLGFARHPTPPEGCIRDKSTPIPSEAWPVLYGNLAGGRLHRSRPRASPKT